MLEITPSSITISIIIPAFNVESYIEDCLLSVINQNFTNYEVIIINDGSTDNSKKIIKRIINDKCNYKLYSQNNTGVSAARNKGLMYAKGKYICFLDSDDKLSDNALATLAALCNENNLDTLVYGMKIFKVENGCELKIPTYNRPADLDKKILSGRDYFKKSMEQQIFGASVGLYWLKRTIALKHSFYEGIIHEDNLYTAQILLDKDCRRLLIISDPMYLRRIRQGSITTSKHNRQHYLGFLTVYKELAAYFESANNKLDAIPALVVYRRSIFLSFVIRLVSVHNIKIPISMRIELFKCLKISYGALYNFKCISCVLFPYLSVKLRCIKRKLLS